MSGNYEALVPETLRSETPSASPKAGLTRIQWAALLFIDSYVTANGFSPTFNEIRVDAGLASKSGVHRIVHALIERGYIAFLDFTPRSIVLTEQAHTALATYRSKLCETIPARLTDSKQQSERAGIQRAGDARELV